MTGNQSHAPRIQSSKFLALSFDQRHDRGIILSATANGRPPGPLGVTETTLLRLTARIIPDIGIFSSSCLVSLIIGVLEITCRASHLARGKIETHGKCYLVRRYTGFMIISSRLQSWLETHARAYRH